ncbi:tenascin-X-like isoform X2 [Gambusia affinis]|uniref:tenascin-X-like isoform X2 n=1 Tax=Gambusia affinis TaxID=33528 RepID=UPI001CDC4C99|nr:tenascin-X-like isoform X2 [Gambusia affinis]
MDHRLILFGLSVFLQTTSLGSVAAVSCTGCDCCASGTECITTNGVVQCLDPCVNYTVLNDAWRSTKNTDNSVLHCDRNIVWSGWYRFYLDQTSAQMPEKCVAERRCGTHAPLWINGTHPVQLNEIVTRNVFGAWSGSCFYFASMTIQIKLCSGYYVYKVQLPSGCSLAYCTEIPPFKALALSETSITLQWSATTTSFVLQYDGTETNINAAAGAVTYTVSSLTAGTKYTFTLYTVNGNVRDSGQQLTAVTAPQNAEGFKKLGQDETSITLQWNKINNSTSFVLQYDGKETNINVPVGDGPVIHIVSSLTAGTKYTFTLFSVFENVKSSGNQLVAVTAPQNAGGFTKSGQNESSITLQWNKINNSTSFVLQFNGSETNINAPVGDGPVTHTVSSLTAGTKYTFRLFSVFENVRSSGIQFEAVTAPQNAEGFKKLGQDETSITLQWNKINNSTSFVLQYDGKETNINAPVGDGPVNYTVSSLTAGTRYTFTLFSLFENVKSSGNQLVAVTAPQNAGGFTKSGQNESSITLQWNKINNSTSFVLQFNGSETNINAPVGDGPVTHTVSSLTAGTKYTFSLFSVFENVRSSGIQFEAVTAPLNAEGFKKSGQYKSSITLQWNKINNSTSFVLQCDGKETNFNAPDGDGPVNYTVSSLTPRTIYTFTLFSVFENVRSSGVQLVAFLEPNYIIRMKLQFNSQRLLSDSEMQDVLVEFFKVHGLSQFSLKVHIIKP